MKLPTEIFGDVVVVHTPEEVGTDTAQNLEKLLTSQERAKVIVDLVEGNDAPAHLLLGSDAVQAFQRADSIRQKEAEAWAKVSLSTDFAA